MSLRYLSLFAGVGGFDQGADNAGWECVGQVEWDKHCQRVLARHWPNVPRWGDVTDFLGSNVTADVVVGGFPCQDVSVAGNRAGITAGTRSGLYGQIIRIVKEMRNATAGVSPRWVVLENVAGLLSIDKGQGFARVLDDLADMGALVIEWGLADTQFFGPPQRRRRIFIIACLDPDLASRCPNPLLPLSPSLPRHLATRRTTGQDVAGTLGGGSGSRGWAGDTDRMTFLPVAVSENQRGELRTANTMPALSNGGGKPGQGYPAVAYPVAVRGRDGGSQAELGAANPANTLRAGASRSQTVLTPELVVRRLTPNECEALQGWPDNWTAYTTDGTEIADSHRYRMVGNGISAPVARWLAEQINRAEP